MADIAGTPPSSTSEIQKTELEFDPETMRETKPRLKRLALTLTVLFSFLLGLPFLLKSVEIYRSPLPFREISDLSAAVETNPLHFPCKFRAVFVDMIGASPNELSTLIEYNMRKLAAKDSTSCGACGYSPNVSVALELGSDCFHSDSDFKWKCGSLNEVSKYGDLGGYDDEWFDDYLKSLLDDNGSSNNGGKVYTVIVVRREKRKENVSIVVGKYRHAWIVGRVSEEEAVIKVAEMFVKAFVNGGKEEGPITGEFMPVGADGRIVLSFNLLNADPRDWTYNWDFQEIDDNLLAPITEALKPLADISVESQVLYHTPKSSFSYWDDRLGTYIFTTKDLPFFVNSNEWHLDTSVAAGGRSKILHFVVYVPSARECPLLLQLPSGEISTTNGFISPMWGSVVVWNPSACFEDSKMETHVRNKISPEETTSRRAEARATVERSLNSRLQEAESRDAEAEVRERSVNESLSHTLSRINVLEVQISYLRTEQTQLSKSLEKKRQRAAENRQEYLALKEEAKTHEGHVIQLEEEIKEMKRKHKQELHESLTHRELLQQGATEQNVERVIHMYLTVRSFHLKRGSEEPTECDHGVDLQQPLLIKIDSFDSHQK